MGRSNVVLAIDALTNRGLLTTRQGTPIAPATYQVNLTKTAVMGGPVTGPPPAASWSQSKTTPDLFQDHRGPETGPPPTENTAVARAAAASDFDGATLRLIDRVISAKAASFDPNTIQEYRRHLHGIMARFGRDEDNRPFDLDHPPHPPTDNQVAALLSVADEGSIARLLQTLFIECQSGAHPMYSYMWFAIVALQRCQGISFEAQKQARAALTIARKQKRQHQAEQLTLDDDANAGDIRAAVDALAQKKIMGR